MSLVPPADVRTHLTTSRQLLIDEHVMLGRTEECLRIELDNAIAQRASVVAAIIDLDRLLAEHFAIAPAGDPPPVATAGTVVTPLAAPKPAVSPPARPVPADRSRTDWGAVAAWIIAAKAAGEYSLVNLGVAFGRPDRCVKNWPGECRRRNLLPATTATPPAVTPAPPSTTATATATVARGAAPVPPSALMQGDADTPVQSSPDSGTSRSRAESPMREPARSAPVGSTATAASSDAAGRPAGDTTRVPKKTGRPRTVDYDDAAQVVAAAQAAGQLPVPALMKHYGKTESFAKNLLRRLRLAGALPASPNANIRIIEDVPDPDDPTPPKLVKMPMPAEIAETYREAIKANRRPIQTIVDRYDCTREHAQRWVEFARAAGELPPKGEPVLPASDAPVQFVPRS